MFRTKSDLKLPKFIYNMAPNFWYIHNIYPDEIGQIGRGDSRGTFLVLKSKIGWERVRNGKKEI